MSKNPFAQNDRHLNRIVNIVVYHIHTEHNKKKLFKDTKGVIRQTMPWTNEQILPTHIKLED